jgi:hypothetical protein
MIDIIGVMIGFIWDVLSLTLTFDEFSFKIWQFMAFFIIIAFIVKAIKTNTESGGNSK